MKIVVLGAGLVGAPMAFDLEKTEGFEVTVIDYCENSLKQFEGSKIITKQADLSKPENLKKEVAEFDLVLNALPGFMGFQTFKTVIEAGKDIIDIAFFPEDPLQLDDLAKEKNVTAIMDIGVAPGMSNLLAGYVNSILDKTTNILIYVGGLPIIREWPYEYKAVFSPIDVIEEYTRTARYIENGELVCREALSDPEFIDFPGVGTLEVFNTDGLRSLMYTIDCPNMKEKTMRYPGHIEKMRVLRETGLFSEEPIEINGQKIRPIDFTSKLLFPMWEMKEGDKDLTVMKIIIEGEKDGKEVKYEYDLLDKFDTKTDTHSMARTTGYTATAAIRMFAAGLFKEKGVFPPELIGKNHDCVKFILDDLKQRNIDYIETIDKQ